METGWVGRFATGIAGLWIASGIVSAAAYAESSLRRQLRDVKRSPVEIRVGVPAVTVALSIHVESYGECPLGLRGEQLDAAHCSEDKYERHFSEIAVLDSLFVNSLQGVQLPLSFELEENFLSAASAFDEGGGAGRFDQLLARGHTIAAHMNAEDYYRGSVAPEIQTRFGNITAPMAPFGGQMRMQEHFSYMKETLESRRVQRSGWKVLSLSGVCSAGDWLKAARDSGFAVVGGVVSYCLASLPQHVVPAGDVPGGGSSIESACENVGDCHATYPYLWFNGSSYELKDSTRAWRMETSPRSMGGKSSNWLRSAPKGVLANVPGVGTLPCLAEKRGNTNRWDSNLHCEFCQDDLDAYFEILDQALSEARLTDPRIVATVVSVGEKLDEVSSCSNQVRKSRQDLLAEFARRMQSDYVTPGKVTWRTIPSLGAGLLK